MRTDLILWILQFKLTSYRFDSRINILCYLLKKNKTTHNVFPCKCYLFNHGSLTNLGNNIHQRVSYTALGL